jgi:hypothetical protein
MKIFKILSLISVGFFLITGCATNPYVTIETTEGRFYKTEAQTDAEALKICQEKYAKKKAVFKDFVFGQNMMNPAKSYVCRD